jgi:hypothetical protein
LLSGLFTTVLILPLAAGAFETPFSDIAVRDAYFLGQRHDESLGRFLDKYIKRLPPSKSRPYVSSVAFYTPFALLAQFSSPQAQYSAQQGQIHHRQNREMPIPCFFRWECAHI